MSRALPAAHRLDTIDIRTGGRWSKAQGAKNTLIATAVRAALAIADRLPAAGLALACRLLAAAAWVCSPALRSRTRSSLRTAYPDPRARPAARRCVRTAADNLTRCLLLRRPGFRVLEHVDLDGASRRTFDAALEHGRGVVFVSAHLGPFEWLAAAVADLGLRPAIVVRESFDPRLDPIVDRHRLARGIEVIHRGHPNCAARIRRALRQGRPVGFLPDLGGRVRCVPTHFLGREAAFPVGPAVIARACKAPLLVGVLQPTAQPDRFRTSIERVQTRGTHEEVTQRVAGHLTRAILSHPEHWLWMGHEPDRLPPVTAER